MTSRLSLVIPVGLGLAFATWPAQAVRTAPFHVSAATVNRAVAADRSRPLASLGPRASFIASEDQTPWPRSQGAPAEAPKNPAGARVEQTSMGTKPDADVIASFDGLGVGFEGPHGAATVRNPSDNSLAVGPDHIVQTVNSRFAIFTKKGRRYETTGRR